jgi:hypothetical protein
MCCLVQADAIPAPGLAPAEKSHAQPPPTGTCLLPRRVHALPRARSVAWLLGEFDLSFGHCLDVSLWRLQEIDPCRWSSTVVDALPA